MVTYYIASVFACCIEDVAVGKRNDFVVVITVLLVLRVGRVDAAVVCWRGALGDMLLLCYYYCSVYWYFFFPAR